MLGSDLILCFEYHGDRFAHVRKHFVLQMISSGQRLREFATTVGSNLVADINALPKYKLRRNFILKCQWFADKKSYIISNGNIYYRQPV